MLMRNIVKILLYVVILVSLAACTTTSSNRSNNQIHSAYKHRTAGATHLAASDEEDDLPADYPTKALSDGDLWNDFRDNLGLDADTHNRETQAQVRWFQNHQGYLNHTIENGAPYLYAIYQETRKLHLPAELALIPINESAYNPFLYSRTGATGLWQMMPGTASGFGLRINWWYDGRRDVVASTKAALKYITYLHYFFNDWLLAIAAYDAGEGRVQAAILYNQRHNLPTDFWSLPLPKETRAYVPRLLALAEIIKNSDHYGVDLLAVNNAPYFEDIDVGSQLDLTQAAKLAGISSTMLRKLNPGYRRWALDPDGPYHLLIPKNNVSVFKERLAALPDSDRVLWQKHIVAKGESLKSIAQKYHFDLATLRQVNELSSGRVHIGQEIIIPYNHHDDAEVTGGIHNASVAEEKIPGPKQVVHTVQPGETLNSVARKYGVKPHQVAYWNQLDANNTVAEDDELVIWQDASSATHKSVKIHVFSYRVKANDTLFSVAKRYHVSVSKLASINHLQQHTLHAGQILKIPKGQKSSGKTARRGHHKTHHAKKH